VGTFVSRLLLAIWLVATGYPVVWMLSTSLRTNADVVTRPWGLPSSFLWQNYREALEKAPLLRYLLNSAVVSVASVTLVVLISAMAAYALARLRFRGQKPLFYATLLGLGIPTHIALVPLFVLNLKLNVADTYLALIGPNVAFGIPFGVLMIRSFMLSLPSELEEAAEIDGCSRLAMFWRIFLPLSQPALAVVAVFTFVGIWNEFLFALTFIHEPSLKTLPIGLMDFVGEFTTQWPLMAAGMVIATVPMIVFYVVLQRRLAEAMTTGARKG
jgi:raffinose/stachyose/melibiose transport system permease protein